MASQKGIVKLKGSLGGICFYKMNKESLSRKSAGPDKETLLTKPSYACARENMQEFGGASVIGKTLRQSLSTIRSLIHDPYLTGRMTALMKEVIVTGDGIRGERSFSVSKYSSLLGGFELNPGYSFNTICKFKRMPVQVSGDKTIVVKHIPKFNAIDSIRSPKGSSCFQFVFMSILLSDYVYRKEMNAYMPLHPDLNGKRNITLSDVYGKYDNIHTDILLTTHFDLGIPLPDSVGIIPVIGIVFYEEVNGELYDFTEGTAIMIDYSA